MLDFPAWKIWTIALTAALGLLFAVPNFFSEEAVARWPSILPRQQLSLGLDLRGGSHLMLEAQTEDVQKAKLEALEESVRSELRDADGGAVQFADLSTAGGKLSVTVTDPQALDRAVETLRKLSRPTGGLSGQRDLEVNVVDGNRIVMTQTAAGIAEAVNSAMAQAVEVIRRRIDELGTREPTIVRQGDNRIVVQVPGLQDPSALKALIGKTAKLEFKLVDVSADPALAAQGRAPAGSQVLQYADQPGLVVVKRRALITGDQLVDSKLTTDQNGQPATSFNFDSAGGRRFAKATQQNVGKPFAIILDNKVISAPNINEADPRRQRHHLGVVHHRERQSARHPAALGQAAGRAEGRRGAHRRSRPRRRLDPQGRYRRHRRGNRRVAADDRHLRALRHLFGGGADPQRLHDPRRDVGRRRDTDPAGHCRTGADHRRRG